MTDYPDIFQHEAGDEEQEFYEHHRFVADPGQKPLRIDKFLSNRIENASRSKIQEAAEAGCLLVNDQAVKSNYKVKPGDTVVVMMEQPPRDIQIIPENISLDIVFEDEHLIVVNKAPGMVVHPSYGHYTGTLINALAWHLRDNPLFNQGDLRPGLVHRIDKDTSGLLVVAKTEQAKNNLGEQFFNKTSQRLYTALVWGLFDEKQGTVTGHIGRSLKDRKVMTVFPGGEYGKPAVTHYAVIEELGYVSVVECRLETGRTHQIRAHMRYMGHPIFNDATYGGDEILKGTTFTKYKQFVHNCFQLVPRQALHARTLGFRHPATGTHMHFDSPVAPDMVAVIDRWRAYIANRQPEG